MYKIKADYLHYIICNSSEPDYYYSFKWLKFKEFIFEYIKNTAKIEWIISKKGFGITLNIAIPLSSIPKNIYKKIFCLLY